MPKRLFISIPITETFKQAFSFYPQKYVEKSIRWIPIENLHITLFFIGEKNEDEMLVILKKIKEVVPDISPFELTFKEVLWAPPGKQKRMVWGEFEKSDPFSQLVHTVGEKIISGYNARAVRPPIPHVTLARIKDSRKIQNLKLEQPGCVGEKLHVEIFDLQASKLFPTGAQYRILETYEIV